MGSTVYDFTFEPPGSSTRYPNAYSNGYANGHSSRHTDGHGDHDSFQRPFMPSMESSYREPEQQLPPLTGDPVFDILEWHPAYQSCQRYFLDHAQHEPGTQALCALINIRLPFQYLGNPLSTSTPSSNGPANPYSSTYTRGGSSSLSPNRTRDSNGNYPSPPTFVSLIPYIRRLVVTGFDKPPILHGFFGDDYVRGTLPHLDCERRNYLFAAKHGGWRSCKKQYDSGSGMGGDESLPFMKPLDGAKMDELTAAEKAWSGWLAMEDWMVGPRAPTEESRAPSRMGNAGGGNESLADNARETSRQG